MVEPEVGLPSNADRAALAKILTVVDEYDNCETALDEIQRIAVQTLNEPTPPGGTAGFPTLNISTRSRSPFANMSTIWKPALIPRATLPRSRF